MQNIVLIGMPATGKSTVGVLLAKRLGFGFLDTDLLLQQKHGQPLPVLLDREDPAAFREREQQVVLSLACEKHVIATGGSVVYQPAAMLHLKQRGWVVYLDTPLPHLEQRIGNLDARAVLRQPGQSLAALFTERDPLYRQYADWVLACGARSHEAVVTAIVQASQQRHGNAQ